MRMCKSAFVQCASCCAHQALQCWEVLRVPAASADASPSTGRSSKVIQPDRSTRALHVATWQLASATSCLPCCCCSCYSTAACATARHAAPPKLCTALHCTSRTFCCCRGTCVLIICAQLPLCCCLADCCAPSNLCGCSALLMQHSRCCGIQLLLASPRKSTLLMI